MFRLDMVEVMRAPVMQGPTHLQAPSGEDLRDFTPGNVPGSLCRQDAFDALAGPAAADEEFMLASRVRMKPVMVTLYRPALGICFNAWPEQRCHVIRQLPRPLGGELELSGFISPVDHGLGQSTGYPVSQAPGTGKNILIETDGSFSAGLKRGKAGCSHRLHVQGPRLNIDACLPGEGSCFNSDGTVGCRPGHPPFNDVLPITRRAFYAFDDADQIAKLARKVIDRGRLTIFASSDPEPDWLHHGGFSNGGMTSGQVVVLHTMTGLFRKIFPQHYRKEQVFQNLWSNTIDL
jgi:hypothetical protein